MAKKEKVVIDGFEEVSRNGEVGKGSQGTKWFIPQDMNLATLLDAAKTGKVWILPNGKTLSATTVQAEVDVRLAFNTAQKPPAPPSEKKIAKRSAKRAELLASGKAKPETVDGILEVFGF